MSDAIYYSSLKLCAKEKVKQKTLQHKLQKRFGYAPNSQNYWTHDADWKWIWAHGQVDSSETNMIA